jgi:hypothetical protein
VVRLSRSPDWQIVTPEHAAQKPAELPEAA